MKAKSISGILGYMNSMGVPGSVKHLKLWDQFWGPLAASPQGCERTIEEEILKHLIRTFDLVAGRAGAGEQLVDAGHWEALLFPPGEQVPPFPAVHFAFYLYVCFISACHVPCQPQTLREQGPCPSCS